MWRCLEARNKRQVSSAPQMHKKGTVLSLLKMKRFYIHILAKARIICTCMSTSQIIEWTGFTLMLYSCQIEAYNQKVPFFECIRKLSESLLPNYPGPIMVQSFPLMMTVIGSPWEQQLRTKRYQDPFAHCCCS